MQTRVARHLPQAPSHVLPSCEPAKAVPTLLPLWPGQSRWRPHKLTSSRRAAVTARPLLAARQRMPSSKRRSGLGLSTIWWRRSNAVSRWIRSDTGETWCTVECACNERDLSVMFATATAAYGSSRMSKGRDQLSTCHPRRYRQAPTSTICTGLQRTTRLIADTALTRRTSHRLNVSPLVLDTHRSTWLQGAPTASWAIL